MTANIRPAVKADIADLIVLIDELNVHEDEPTGHMTPERPHATLWGLTPRWGLLWLRRKAR